MLSIENPPPDPPRPRQFLQLKSDSDEIERPSHKLPLPEVDLLNQPSLDHHHHRRYHTSLPKFSIRDYVFTARSKDVKKNWPFSPKNLQLCLKHGLKDPLPPFEPLGTVRNQSLKRCTVEANPLEKQNTRKFVEVLSGSNDRVVLESSNDAHSNHNLSGASIDNTSSRSGEHKTDLPSTTASVSQSETGSVLIDKPSNIPLDSDTSVEASPEVKAAGCFKSQKTENLTRPPSKKCRLIVKFGSHSDRSSTEDIVSNCTTVSELMASKVCPVCKTFSSSSNTTLNAHIDQCLSVESTPKWRADSKLSRHRIKPRKTKLIVDIYATAKPCTLEELDRRNGTRWATASNAPRQDYGRVETSDEGKKPRVSSIHPDDTGNVGAVYIDANGTKLRILSKFDDVPPVSKVGEDLGPHRPHRSLKGGKGGKFFSTKKKRRHAPKHHKYLNLAPQSRKVFSNKTSSSTIVRGQEGYCGVEEIRKSEGPTVPKQIKLNDSGKVRGRLGSKRSGLSRKPNNQERQQPLICKWHVDQDMRIQRDQSHQGDNVEQTDCVRKLKNSSENSVSSPEKCEGIEKPINEAPFIDKREHSFGRKRVRSPLFGARISDKMCRSFHPLKQKVIQFRKENPYVNEDHTVRSLNSGGNCTSSLSKELVDIDANRNLDAPVTATTISHHSFATKCFQIPSPKKNALSDSSRSSTVESRSNMVKKYPTKESGLHFMAEIDEDVAGCSAEDLECDLVHDGAENHHAGKEITEELSFGGSSVRGAGEPGGRVSISGRDETLALKSIQSAPYCYEHDERENVDSSAWENEDILDKVDGLESVEETITSLSQSIETNCKKLSNPSKNRSNSLQNVEDCNGATCGGEGLTDPSRPSLVDKPNMFSAEVGNGMIGQTADVGRELNCDAAQVNSFPEVDPIPIPGPPGSFLPSPRDMSSDDFQGNSSLTTSRVQSSQDQLDFVDGESSDSPISTVSTISNCAEARSSLKYAEPLAFIGAPTAAAKASSGYSSAMLELLVENGAANPQTSTGPERTFEGDKFRVQKIPTEKKPFIFKNDDQPCCCQRKERSSQAFALNYQDSELLRRRTMASLMVPATEMHIGANPNVRPYNLDTIPETFSLSSSTNLGSEQMVCPLMKPPPGPIPLKGYADAGVKLSARGGCASASPSSSNPILRLMGKNLMVVSKEEVGSVPLGLAQSSAQNNNLTSNFASSSGISPSNIRNQGGLPFHHTMPQGSLIFDRNSNDLLGHSFDVRATTGYRNHANLATPQTTVQFPAGMFLDEHMDCGFTPSVEQYKCEGNYNLISQLNRPKNKLGPAAIYEMGKVLKVDCQQQNGDSDVSVKEVIVIDDAPETETNKTTDIAKHSEGLRESQLVLYGISMPLVPPNHIVRPGNPFSHYHQLEESPLLSDPTMVHNNFHAVPFRGGNTSPVSWDCTSEDSGALQRGPFMAVSPSTSHLGSALYYSTSLS